MAYYSAELERRVLSHYIRFDNSLNISENDFTIEEAKNLFLFVKQSLYCNSDYAPWEKIYKPYLVIKNLDIATNMLFLKSLWTEEKLEEKELPVVLEQLKGFTWGRYLQGVYINSIEAFKKGDVISAKNVLVKGLQELEHEVSLAERDDFVKGFTERYKEYLKRKEQKFVLIPTGIKKLDAVIEGVAPCSLNFLQGETSVGKTFFLQEIALKGFLNGFNVVFITIEMKRLEIETRLDGRISQIPYRNIYNANLSEEEEERWKKSIMSLQTKTKGRLGVSFIPEGCTISAVQSELKWWEKQWGDNVNILCLDYADLMATTRKIFSEQEQQGAVYRDLKRLSQTNNIIVWTASQVSSKSYGKLRLDLSDTGYSMRKANWANLILGISSEEEEPNILHVFVAKNTFGKRWQEIILNTNYDYGLVDIYDKE